MKYRRLKLIRETLGSLFRGLAAAFRLRSLKNAFRSVTHNKKEYFCFFVALLTVQIGFLTTALTTDTNLGYARRSVEETYDYHIAVKGMSDEQCSNLENQFQYAMSRDIIYFTEGRFEAGPNDTYNAYFTFDETQSREAAYTFFQKELIGEITREGWTMTTSPLYDFDEDYTIPYGMQFWTVSLLWLLLGVAILVVLYLVRLDHFKFIYGIYMTCGADFPRLFGTAASELIAISTITLLSSVPVSVGLTALLYLPQGVTLSLSMRTVVTFFLLNLLCVLAAVYMPMRKMSRKPPVTLLGATDNSPLVTSPRRSFRLFGEGFPYKYELYSFRRLRKYYLRLVLSAVLFASLFISGLYIAEMADYKTSLDSYEYLLRYGVTVDHTGSEAIKALDVEEADMIRTDLDTFLPYIEAVEGVSYADWHVSLSGGMKLSHLLIKPDQLGTGVSEYIVSSDERASDGYTRATINYAYTAVDKTYIDSLIEHNLAEIEGDPYAMFENEHMVVITEDIFNTRSFQFSPGDKITVAAYQDGSIDVVLDAKEMLRQQIKKFDFQYIEYTICAVIRGLPSEDKITFGVTFDEYAALTETVPVRNSIKIYMENGADMETVMAAEDGIRAAVANYSGWTVTATDNYFASDMTNRKNDRALTLILAAMLLCISPLVWFFSQIMFYRKRRGEFYMLHAMGAPDKDISGLFRVAGGILSGLAFLVTTLLSLLCNFLIYICINTLLPKLGLIQSINYDYALSLPALIACIVISIICGFLSCEAPLHMAKKHGFGNRQIDRR